MLMSVCGVMCWACPAYLASETGVEHQRRTAEAWHRIYALNETPENIACGGCLGSDQDLFYTSRTCAARLCCRSKGLASCAECPEEQCPDLEKAQSVWDTVPELFSTLTPDDFEEYAEPYCGHRERLKAVRAAIQARSK